MTTKQFMAIAIRVASEAATLEDAAKLVAEVQLLQGQLDRLERELRSARTVIDELSKEAG